MPPLKALEDPFWGLIHHTGPPLQFWGGQDIYGPGPSQWDQAMYVKYGSMGQFMVPSKIGPRASILVLGASNRPHRPWTADHRTPKTKKRPKKAIEAKRPIFTQDPKKGHKINIHQELPWQGPRPKRLWLGQGEAFPIQMGTRPLEDFFKTFSAWKEGSNISLALGN
ncbi:hypothetical protein O181_072306 [Austropuccinia psidii MF-1]|uniref:Uncharacterized protein n=1 Tax=Austropuccinia psidii MF-1 TaxID=1389203 RepID=A0A9Q3F2G7_9BASI|nr:hypothetical protein [Austropuccinia psidii MF-1]